RVFATQTGQSIDARIASWEQYLSTRGTSPYADAIRRDLDVLRSMRDRMRPASNAAATEVVATVQHAARSMATAGQPVPVVFVLQHPDRVASAFLHSRPRDARTYRRALLVREHAIYLRGAVPADVVAAPGFDYFVEVSTPQGASGLALGSPTEPVQ